MNIGKKARLSMSQFLDIFTKDKVDILMNKFDFSYKDEDGYDIPVDQIMLEASDESILDLYDEIKNTSVYLENISQVNEEAFKERFNDLEKYFKA